MLRFHSPLIKLDRRFSRIQLSDKASHTFAHEQLPLGSLKLDKAQLLVKVRVRVAVLPRTLPLELRAQPLTYPLADMRVDASVGFADGPDPEIVGPTPEFGVDPPNLFVYLPPSRPARRHLMDLAAQPLDFLPGRAGAQVRLARPAVIVPPQGITQKVERLLGQAAQARLVLVHRQLELDHHPPQYGHGLLGRAATADDEVVRIVDDVCVESALMAPRLPSLDKASHVDVRQRRRDRRALRRSHPLVLVPGRAMAFPF